MSVDKDDNAVVEEDTEGDSCGHGTACAGIVRSIAPECNLHSVRVLGAGFTGSGRCCSPASVTRSNRGTTSST